MLPAHRQKSGFQDGLKEGLTPHASRAGSGTPRARCVAAGLPHAPHPTPLSAPRLVCFLHPRGLLSEAALGKETSLLLQPQLEEPVTQDKERERHEEERLASVEGYIGYRAHLYSRDVPDQKEDFAQAAREAVVKKLRDDPDCPISHLKVTAKSAILNYRSQGSSIDGKLNESKRSKTWETLSLDEPVAEDGGTRQDMLSEKSHVQRVTEEQALHRTLMDDLRSQLSARENQVLGMRLDGASWQEVTRSLGNSVGDYRSPTRRRITEAAERALTYSADTPTNGKAEGASNEWQRKILEDRAKNGKVPSR